MRSLPSWWRGVEFRSRTEARWAVYFDALGIAWEYEPEGVLLECGPYLPDFWLPRLKAWAEVKPRTGFTPAECEKCMQLCEESEQRALLLPGPPDFRAYEMLTPSGIVSPPGTGPAVQWVGLWGKWLHREGEPCYCGPGGERHWDDEDAQDAVWASRRQDLMDARAGVDLPLGWEGVPVIDGDEDIPAEDWQDIAMETLFARNEEVG